MEKEKKEKLDSEEVVGAATENKEESPCPEEASPGEGEAVPGESPDQVEEEDWTRQREELINLVQRKQADLDNFRRISRMKEEEIRSYGLAEFLTKLLPVLDNMERALATAREDGSVPESHIRGLTMIQKQLLQLLEQEGVVPFEALGEMFDPRFHEAVVQCAEGQGEPGSVVEELQKGYLYKDRVLRHAKVKVMQV